MAVASRQGVQKAPTGIEGLDEVTGGGLPRERTTLVCGGPGCGKTLFGVQFVVRGALDHGEPGVIVAFEESADALAENVASLGWDLDDLVARGLLAVDYMRVAASEIVETGAWDLDGLLIRLAGAIEQVGAKRVVIDSVELLFAALGDERLLRSELRRVFDWLGERGVTAIVTGERGTGSLTRHGLEEYVSDCVIFLDHTVVEQVSTRRLRIVKYRGSGHGSDEHPFLIDAGGISVAPVSSMRLEHRAAVERVATGIEDLDTMLAGGVYRGSTVLIAGPPGTGKTTFATTFLAAACERGERAMMFAFEEAPEQIIRNMGSVGLDLAAPLEAGLLQIVAARPAAFGLEGHLARLHQEIAAFAPSAVVFDPVSSLHGQAFAVEAMLARLIDFGKTQGITALLTALVGDGESPRLGISSVMDTWIELSNRQHGGERNRGVSVVKSRGTAHSNQLREFRMTDAGVVMASPYGRPGGVLMGAERLAEELAAQTAVAEKREALEARQRRWARRRAEVKAQIERLELELEIEGEEVDQQLRQVRARDKERAELESALVAERLGGAPPADPSPNDSAGGLA